MKTILELTSIAPGGLVGENIGLELKLSKHLFGLYTDGKPCREPKLDGVEEIVQKALNDIVEVLI